MSGTSLDGVDGVLVRFSPQVSGAARADSLNFVSIAFAPQLRAELFDLQQIGHGDLMRAYLAGNAIADVYADVVACLLRAHHEVNVRAIGAHGQTVRHDPANGVTIQLLNGARLAERCGIDVVCDFRSADVAAGGQGAPLVPAFHRGIFASDQQRRAIVNIGGIANVSLLAPNLAPLGFDTGPGNCLLDAWIRRAKGLAYDADGGWSAGGTVNYSLLQQLLNDPYILRSGPKSTHRDYFGLDWVDAAGAAIMAAQDVQATLAELTAISITHAVQAFDAQQVFVCGGGARNLDLMNRLRSALKPVTVATTADLGVDPQSVEALAFAWLALQRLQLAPGNEPAVTGALGPRVLGAWHAART